MVSAFCSSFSMWNCKITPFNLIYMNLAQNISGELWAEKNDKRKKNDNNPQQNRFYDLFSFLISVCASCSSSALNSETFTYILKTFTARVCPFNSSFPFISYIVTGNAIGSTCCLKKSSRIQRPKR